MEVALNCRFSHQALTFTKCTSQSKKKLFNYIEFCCLTKRMEFPLRNTYQNIKMGNVADCQIVKIIILPKSHVLYNYSKT